MNPRDYLDRLLKCDELKSWTVSFYGEDLLYLHLPCADSSVRPRLYLSAGIHGDEPAGPIAIYNLLKRGELFKHCEVWIFPLLNPTGMSSNRRENNYGRDQNREYFEPISSEVFQHLAVLKKLPKMDCAVCLHEDWEAEGCYLYHINEEDSSSRAQRVIGAMGQIIVPDLSSTIDGQEALNGVIERKLTQIDRTDWPEAIYLANTLTGSCFTLETPSTFALEKRVECLEAGVSEVLTSLGQKKAGTF